MTNEVFVAPVLRPDSAPVNINPVRRFREELRLDRERFVQLLGGIPVATLRGWEEPFDSVHYHEPRKEFIQKLVALAQRNRYPLFEEDITPKGKGRDYIVRLKIGSKASADEVAHARVSLLETVKKAR